MRSLGRRSARGAARWALAAVLASAPAAVLALGGCATDALTLAPPAPDKPWPIPDDAVRDAAAQGPAPDAPRPDPDRRYDLPALIDLAQRASPETREAWEQARQAALSVGLAEATFLPQIEAQAVGGFQRTPLPIPTALVPRGYFNADTAELVPTLTAKWLLFDFGRREGLAQAARANAFVADVAFTGAHQKLIYDVTRDYLALSAAQAMLGAAKQAQAAADTVRDSVADKRAHGLATTVQDAQARREAAQARFDVAQMQGQADSARATLIAALGIGHDETIRIADDQGAPPPDVPGALDGMIREALSRRPDVIAALGRIRASDAALSAAQAEWLPTVGLRASAYENIGGLSTDGGPYSTVTQPGYGVLVQLSWTLFDGGAREARIAAARSQSQSARDALDKARDGAARDVTAAYVALRTGLAEQDAVRSLLAASRTAYDAALESYRSGVGTYTDLASSQAALARAQAQSVQVGASIRSAAAALAFATGQIAGPS